jgi:hypothetical protein
MNVTKPINNSVQTASPVQPKGPAAPAPAATGLNLARLLSADLQLLRIEFGVSEAELADLIGVINGELPPADLLARIAASPKKLEFFSSLVKFLLGESADFRQAGSVCTKEELAKLLTNNQRLRQLLVDYGAYKTGTLRLEASESSFLAISKGGTPILLSGLNNQELKDLTDFLKLKQPALSDAQPLLAGLLGQPISSLKQAKDQTLEILFANKTTVTLTFKEIELFSQIKQTIADSQDFTRLGAKKDVEAAGITLTQQLQELEALGYSIAAPGEETEKTLRDLNSQRVDLAELQGKKPAAGPADEASRLKLAYQAAGQTKIGEFLTALSPFAALSNITVLKAATPQDEQALLTNATRLHAVVSNLKQDLSFFNTTLPGLGVDMTAYDRLLDDDQKILELVTNEAEYRKNIVPLGELVKKLPATLDPQIKKSIDTKLELLQKATPAYFAANQQLEQLLFAGNGGQVTYVEIKDAKGTKPADVINALYEYSRSAFRQGLPQVWLDLKFGGGPNDYTNLNGFSHFVGDSQRQYAAPVESEPDEKDSEDVKKAKKEALAKKQAAYDALCEKHGSAYWSRKPVGLQSTLLYSQLPIPAVRGKVAEKVYFSDGLVRLVSLRAERLPGSYLSDAEALVRGNVIGQNSERSLAPLLLTLAQKSGQPLEKVESFFHGLIEEKAEVVLAYDTVNKKPLFYYLRANQLSPLKPEEQLLLTSFWELSYGSELTNEQLTLQNKLNIAIDSSIPEGEAEQVQVETLAFKLAAYCVKNGKADAIRGLSQQDIDGVLQRYNRLLQAGRDADEMVKSSEQDVTKAKADLAKKREEIKKEAAKYHGAINKQDDNVAASGTDYDEIAGAGQYFGTARQNIDKFKKENEKAIAENEERVKKFEAILELANFFVESGRKIMGADANSSYLLAVAGRVKTLIEDLPKGGADTQAMLAQVASANYETRVLTPAVLRSSILGSAGNAYVRNVLNSHAGTVNQAPDNWDKTLLHSVPFIGETTITSEQGLYGLVLNHPSVAVLAYLSDELNFEFWSEGTRTNKNIPLDIDANLSGAFLARLGSSLVKKYGDKFQYLIAAGEFMQANGLSFGDREVATPTTIAGAALGLQEKDQRLADLNKALEFLNGVYLVSERKFQPAEGADLARSFDLRDKSLGNRFGAFGRSFWNIPLSGAQKQLQMIVGRDIMLMREDLGLAIPAQPSSESFNIDAGFVTALLGSRYKSYLKSSAVAAFFGQAAEKPVGKVAEEAIGNPEKFLRDYLKDHPDLSFSLDLGFDDAIDERTAWAKLLVMKVLSNYAVSENSMISRNLRKLAAMPDLDTILTAFTPQDMTESGNWNRSLNIYLYQNGQLTLGPGTTLKANSQYSAAQINFLGQRLLETVQPLSAESQKQFFNQVKEQINGIFSVAGFGEIETVAELETLARALVDYRGNNISFEDLGLAGSSDPARKALYVLSRVFLPSMSARARGEDGSKIVASQFLKRYRQELKAGKTLVINSFAAPAPRPGIFQYQPEAKESQLSVGIHFLTEFTHLQLFMNPEIMIGLQLGFIMNIGKALREGRRGDAVELFWQQLNTLASFAAYGFFPPALLKSALEKWKQGNTGGAGMDVFFAIGSFRMLFGMAQNVWRNIKHYRYNVAEINPLGRYDQAVDARIAALDQLMVELEPKINEFGRQLAEIGEMQKRNAAPAEIERAAAELRKTQLEIRALTENVPAGVTDRIYAKYVSVRHGADSPESTQAELNRTRAQLNADKYTKFGSDGTRVAFTLLDVDGRPIEIERPGIRERLKTLSPYRRNNTAVDVLWNLQDLAVEGVTLGGAQFMPNEDLTHVSGFLGKMTELARKGDEPITVQFESQIAGAKTIKGRPSMFVRAFYLHRENVTRKVAALGEKVLYPVIKPAEMVLDKNLTVPLTAASDELILSQEFADFNNNNSALFGEFISEVAAEKSHCNVRLFARVPAKFFNANEPVTRVIDKFFRQLPAKLRRHAAPPPIPVETPVPPLPTPVGPLFDLFQIGVDPGHALDGINSALQRRFIRAVAKAKAEGTISGITFSPEVRFGNGGESDLVNLTREIEERSVRGKFRVVTYTGPESAKFGIEEELGSRVAHSDKLGLNGAAYFEELLNPTVRPIGAKRRAAASEPVNLFDRLPANSTEAADLARLLGKDYPEVEQMSLEQINRQAQARLQAVDAATAADLANHELAASPEQIMNAVMAKAAADPAKKSRLLEFFKSQDFRAHGTGFLVGLATILGAEELADALQITSPAKRFVFILGLSHTANVSSMAIYQDGLRKSFARALSSELLARNTALAARVGLAGKLVGNFSVNLVKGLVELRIIGNLLHSAGLENPTLNMAASTAVLTAGELALGRLSQQELGTLAARVGRSASVLRLAAIQIALADIAIGQMYSGYEQRVFARARQLENQKHGLPASALAAVPDAVIGNYIAGARNVGDKDFQNYVAQVKVEDLQFSEQTRAELARVLTGINIDEIVPLLSTPVDWGTYNISRQSDRSERGLDGATGAGGAEEETISERIGGQQINEYAESYKGQNQIDSFDDPRVAAAVIRRFGISRQDYDQIAAKRPAAFLQQNFARLYLLNPSPAETRFPTNNDVREMFNADGTLRPGKKEKLIEFIKDPLKNMHSFPAGDTTVS